MSNFQVSVTFTDGAQVIFGLEAPDTEAAWSWAGEMLALFRRPAEDLQVVRLDSRRWETP